jgi:endoglycosylceramidase
VGPDWIAFLEPSSLRNTGIATQLLPFELRDVVYAPHAYDAAAESGQGFSADDRAAYLDNVALLAGEARGLGAALWIGEYGGVAADPGIGDYMDAAYDAAGAAAAGAMYWHYGRDDGYGLLDPAGEEKPALLEAVVRPWPARVAGDPIEYGFDEDSRRFTLVWTPDRAIAAPTELVLPARVYPDGWQVDCDGCASEPMEGGVRITAPPAGEPAVVTITAGP